MIGENLMKLRKKQGYSQQEVADQLSVTRQTVSNWECDQAVPAVDKAAQLAKLYHVSLDDLIENNIEVVTKDTTEAKDISLLKRLIGKSCKIDCDDSTLLETEKVKVLDVNSPWMRIEYQRPQGMNLFKKETVIKLIDLDDVNGLEIVEDEG